MASVHLKFTVTLCLINTLAQCRISSEPLERAAPPLNGQAEASTTELIAQNDHNDGHHHGDDDHADHHHGDHQQQNGLFCDGFGWTLHRDKCYKVLEGRMDWSQVIAACKSEGAILVCIRSEEENRFVGKMIAKPIERSLDNYRLETTLFNTFWIGLNRVKNGNKFESTWVNGEKARFGDLPEITTESSTTNGKNKYPWGEGEPSGTNKFTDPTGTKEECVHMFSADGRWNDAECRVQMSGGVCQKMPKYN